MQLSEVRKAVVNVLTAVVTAGPWILKAMNVLPGTNGTVLATIISAVLGLVAFVLHYLTPNETINPAVAATQSVRLAGSGPARRVADPGTPTAA